MVKSKKKKTAGAGRRKTGTAATLRGVVKPDQLQQEVLAFFTTTHETLLAAKKKAEAELKRRAGAEAVLLAAREGKPLGGPLEQAVNQYAAHLAPEYTYVDPSGELVNRARMVERLRSGVGIFDDFVRSQAQVRVYGNRAVVTSMIKVRGESAGQEITGQYYETHTLVRDAGLLLLASHLTKVQELNALLEKLVDACG